MRPRPLENPKNPWLRQTTEYLAEDGPPLTSVRVYEDQTREILSQHDSPDLGFRYSVNPYRGCMHACAYCYARPTHEYLGFGAGSDFDTQIVLKPRAAELLTEAFERPSWTGETVVFSGATDPYQPLEASYELTRACLEVCLRYRNPVAVITKAPLVERDRELLAALAREIPPETVTTADPYYGRVKRFAALPMERVLAAGFAGEGGALATRHFVLRARDGYTVPISGERLLEGGAYIAIRDLDVAAWEPIGPQRADPSPAYLVWSRPSQGDLETHPRPWQLAAVEVARFEDVFPHVAPVGEAPDAPASLGFALFARECVRCHAINREGGRVGPELNVPQNITEYRPETQIRAYIRDPRTFRYGNMPAHPGLTEADLDHLVAYLRAMASRKHDPDADAGR